MNAEKNDSQIKNVEDLPLLKEKLYNLLTVLDNIEIRENLNDKNDEEFDLKIKYKEMILLQLNEEISNIRLNFRQSVEKIMNNFDETIEETLKLIDLHKLDLDNYKKYRKEENKNDSIQEYFFEKNFKNRESIITELMNYRQEFRTLKNMLLAVMIILFINLMCQDYFDNGYFINIQTLVWCFTGFEMVAFTWLIMIFYSYLIIFFSKFVLNNKPILSIWLTLYFSYISILIMFACQITSSFELSFGSSMIIMTECFRIVMKIHSYFRNKLLYCTKNNEKYINFIPKWIKEKGFKERDLYIPKMNMDETSLEIQKFTYFLFSPTLIYRDIYPLRAKIDFSFFLNSVLEFVLCIYYIFIMYRIYMQPQFILIGKEEMNSKFFMAISKTILPSFLCLYLIFYCVIHSWFNLWSEILRFPDRRFYGDWWNSKDFRTWFKKFITINSEWFVFYCYFDILRFSDERISKKVAKFITFTLNSIYVLIVITYSLKFLGVYQFLFIFIITYLLIFHLRRNNEAYNTIFWVELCLGITIVLTIYCREYYFWEGLKSNQN